jgi:hypothetical protein
VAIHRGAFAPLSGRSIAKPYPPRLRRASDPHTESSP